MTLVGIIRDRGSRAGVSRRRLAPGQVGRGISLRGRFWLWSTSREAWTPHHLFGWRGGAFRAILRGVGPVEFVVTHRVPLGVALATWLLLWFWSGQRLTDTQRWVDDHLRVIEGVALLGLVVWFVLTSLGAFH